MTVMNLGLDIDPNVVAMMAA
ncbi:hypothetical protein FP2506_17279 [Fulvimarina pelagi HTCC2506]|uniref:Uncharacterized protein n=1 Tax=Fulvimarina pelagi HTCC2506 TaxID=314231 RepID=Q0FY92_9HYPH|nr:hypothetical protein FP2506_17279 [Fulvimarina pelagi HTCC2506]